MSAGTRCKGNEDWFKEPFLAIILDTANTSRIADPRWKKAKFKIKIDHHPEVEKYGKVSIPLRGDPERTGHGSGQLHLCIGLPKGVFEHAVHVGKYKTINGLNNMEKLFWTIGETAEILGENVSLVRYWRSEGAHV